MTSIRRLAAACLTASLVWCLAEGAPPARAETTLKVVMHSDLKIVDPIWTGCVRDACNFSRLRRCPAEFTLLDRTIIF